MGTVSRAMNIDAFTQENARTQEPDSGNDPSRSPLTAVRGRYPGPLDYGD
jgi:hypothetical protein